MIDLGDRSDHPQNRAPSMIGLRKSAGSFPLAAQYEQSDHSRAKYQFSSTPDFIPIPIFSCEFLPVRHQIPNTLQLG
jgi:hypothetical protein